jgi:hypothetical protein
MNENFLQRVDAMVRAAMTEDQAFSDLMPQVMRESQDLPPVVLNMAMMKLGEGVAAAPPNLGCWLAIMAGAWVENGATTFAVDRPVLDKALEVAGTAAAFAETWRKATGGEPPDPVEGRPSQEIVDTLAPHLPDPVGTMMAWFALERFALGASTMLAKSPELRAGITDRDGKSALSGGLAEYCGQMGWVSGLLRVLDGERLLVIDRETRHGWTVTIGGIGDNFQLHTLLAAALIGDPARGLLPGRPPTEAEVAAAGTGDDLQPAGGLRGNWNLVDAYGEWIWNEGRPADIPHLDGVRVVVLEPEPYPRTWNTGRQYPLMSPLLRLDGPLPPAEAVDWLRRTKPSTR